MQVYSEVQSHCVQLGWSIRWAASIECSADAKWSLPTRKGENRWESLPALVYFGLLSLTNSTPFGTQHEFSKQSNNKRNHTRATEAAARIYADTTSWKREKKRRLNLTPIKEEATSLGGEQHQTCTGSRWLSSAAEKKRERECKKPLLPT